MSVTKFRMIQRDGLAGAEVSWLRKVKDKNGNTVIEPTVSEYPLPVPKDIRDKMVWFRYHVMVAMGMWRGSYKKFIDDELSVLTLPEGCTADEKSAYADCRKIWDSIGITMVAYDEAKQRISMKGDLSVGVYDVAIDVKSFSVTNHTDFSQLKDSMQVLFDEAWLLVEMKKDVDKETMDKFIMRTMKAGSAGESVEEELSGMNEDDRMNYMMDQLQASGKIILDPERMLDGDKKEKFDNAVLDAEEKAQLKKDKKQKEKTLAAATAAGHRNEIIENDVDDFPVETEDAFANTPIFEDEPEVREYSFGDIDDF